MNGNILGAEKVELLESGVVNGDIKTGSLTVASGSRMRGHVEFGWGDGSVAPVRGWRLAHFSLVFGGMWLLVVAAVSHLLVLSRRGITILVGSVVTSGYAFMLALVVGAIGGVRGLEATGPVLNLVAFVGNIVASIASLVWIAVSLVGAVRALREAETR